MSAMVKCDGCGSNVWTEDVRETAEYSRDGHCEACKHCRENPKLRKAYRTGFNDGLDALAESVNRIVKDSNLRKR